MAINLFFEVSYNQLETSLQNIIHYYYTLVNWDSWKLFKIQLIFSLDFPFDV